MSNNYFIWFDTYSEKTQLCKGDSPFATEYVCHLPKSRLKTLEPDFNKPLAYMISTDGTECWAAYSLLPNQAARIINLVMDDAYESVRAMERENHGI